MEMIQYLSESALMAHIRGRAQSLKGRHRISQREYAHIESFLMGHRHSDRQELVELALALARS